MPPKRQKVRAADSSDDDDEPRSGATKRELPTLIGRENFDMWWEKVNDYFYQKGKKWDEMLTQATDRDATEDDDPDPAEDDTKQRRAAWGALKASLSDEEAKKYRAVAKGRVESLIRSIRATHQKKSEAALDALTNKLIALSLNDYGDLEAYLAEANIIFTDLEAQGEALTDGRKTFYLLKGLPADYEQAKSTLRQPNVEYTYKEVTTYLSSWIETRPACPGYPLTSKQKMSRGKNNERVLYAREQGETNKGYVPLCRNFQRSGKCKHGDDCKFRHEAPPSDKQQKEKETSRRRRCYECGSEDHLIADCPKNKTRRSTRLSQNRASIQRAFSTFVENLCDERADDDSDVDSPPPKRRRSKSAKKKEKSKKSSFTFASFVTEHVYKAAQAKGADMKAVTVIDGGSTCSITTTFADCKNVEPCSEEVTVGGKKGSNRLKCEWKGTRVIRQKDLRGDVQEIEVRDTKIMPAFGVKVLPEHVFLRRGCRIIKDEVGDNLSMEVQHRKSKQVLMRADMHRCGLFFLGNGAQEAFGDYAHAS